MKFLNLEGISEFLAQLKTLFATKNELNNHTSNHAPSNAQANQNAFSNVLVNSTTIVADSPTDTLTVGAGTGISLSADATNDKFTITNAGVRSVSTGTSNGTISVNTNGTSQNVSVKGLGSAAYTNTSAYDTSGAADSALTNAKAYVDEKIDALIGEGASTSLDTIGEISSAIVKNQESITLLNTAVGTKQATITGGASTITSSNLTGSRALISNSSGKVAVSTVTSTQLEYLSGATSNVQTQINNIKTNLTNLDFGSLD